NLPIGALRFALLERYNALTGTVYNALDWDPDCLSNKPPVSTFPNFSAPSGFRVWNIFAAQTGNPSSEDCLSLNIWTKTPNNSARKPVLIWFHGGRFQIPGPHSPFYNGQYLSAAEDIVVVTPSYRLGIFGFSGAPGLQQNAALRDHRSAVEWVRDNIASFSGDPRRITISGQSAGGAAVEYWAFAWKEDPIVAGLISQSGTALSFNPNTKAYGQSIFFNVSQAIGCGGADEDATRVVKCVRQANASAILAASAKVPALPTLALAQATFHPTVDDEIVFGDYEARARNGSFARVPYLVGNGDFESGWYKLSAYAARLNLTEAQWHLFNQRAFTCPTAAQARYRSEQVVPTWRYRYHGEWENLRLYNSTAGLGRRGSGAYHGSDVEMVFGTGQHVSLVANSEHEDAVSAYMMGAWAAFARDPAQGLLDYGWPAYNATGNTLVQLAEPRVFDSPCPDVNDPLPG
ncbi:carboxylesterase, partial [Diaporthe helianthi]